MLLFKRITSLLLTAFLVAGMLPPIHTTAQELETAPVEEIAGETEELPQQTLPAVIPETTTAAETTETTAPTQTTAETTMPQETTAPAEAEETEPAAETEETQEAAEPTEEILVEETVAEECCATAAEVSDNDALFESYLYKVFFGLDSVMPMGTLARDELSDADKYFYDELKKQIILIADGQRTSTVVEVEFENTGYDYYDLSFGAVFDALVNDCPYAMYWYGGASGRFSFGTYIFRVCLQPTASYRGDNYDENNPTIDTSRAINAANAAENARGIVAQFRNYEDYDKLCAYADKICSLVKYDYNAANKNNWSVNIDPWTLVNVFDNNSSTNVVCEGYAEAFQYLCDQSSFERDIVCVSPCGANHKWNIVRISGSSYLMDLTMADVGSSAERKSYFLSGGKGSVENGYKIGGFHYWYYDDVMELWGTGDDSILKLSDTSYDPATAPEPTTITQEKFESALDSCGGSYRLSRELCLLSDLTIEDVELTVASGGSVLVTPGTAMTVSEDASIILETGSELTVETNGTLLAFGTVTSDGGSLDGKGNILLTEFDGSEGVLTLSGSGEVASGDLDRFSGAKQLAVGDGITAVGQCAFDGFAKLEEASFPVSLTRIGAKAFSGCTGLKTIVFRGNAPSFEGGQNFEGVTATVYYPLGNETWTEAVRQNYGGTLTWVAACTNGHTVVTIPGTPPNCVDGGVSDGKYCSLCGEVLAEQEQLPASGAHSYSHASDIICDVCGDVRWIEEPFPFTAAEWEVLKLTNEERKAAGLAPLTSFTTLQQAGDIRAEELLVDFDHMRPDGTACFTVLDELGLSYWYAGENTAGGYRTPASVVNGWMNSQGHRENILNANFDHIGIGENQYNWVQLFISGDGYSDIQLLGGDRLTLEPGVSLEEQNLVGVLFSNSGIQCYLPVTADYCLGYDSSVLGDQTVTVSVLGVSTTVTVHVHDWVEATCTEAKNCALCGETEGDALGHKYKETKTKATCTEPGCTIQTCQVCGDVQTEENEPALGHSRVIDREVAPTCTEMGKTEGMHCSVCDEVLTAQQEVPALGHDEVTDPGYAPTCIRTGLTDGAHCVRCETIVTEQDVIPAMGHTFERGYCIRCGAEDKADYSLYSGKNLTLKQYDPETGKAYTARQVTWSIAEEYEPFATMNKNGKLTAKKVFEKVRVEAVATMTATGEAVIYLVDIYPALTQAEVLRDGDVVNGETILMDYTEESLTLKAKAYPTDTLADVTWAVSDGKKQQYATYDIEGDTLSIMSPKGKAGTVTIKAVVDAGVKKTVTVKVQFGSFAKTVEIEEPEKTTIRGGETLTLSASIIEPQTVTKPGVVWTTSDKTAATVSNGKVTAKNVAHPTMVTITATSKDGQAAASIDLEIIPKNEGQLVLMKDNAFVTNSTKALNVGDTYQLNTAVITDGEPAPAEVTWSTSKATIATVENGLITAVGAGTAKITAECDGMKAVINVKVSTLVADMEITTKDGKNLDKEGDETIVIVSSGKAVNLVANVLTAGANKAVTWEITEGANYAKIATSGKLTANKDLTSIQYITVKATAKDGSGTNATIKVKLLPLATGVQIFQNGTRVRSNTVFVYDIQQGNTLKLNAKVYPAKANQAVQLTSSSKKIADFNENGELVCFKTGTVTITAKALDGSNAKTTFKLTIVKKVTSLSLKEGSDLTVIGGKTLKLAPMVEISPSDATNKKLNWRVSDNDFGIKISSSGVLSTKKVTRPVTVNIMVTPQDGGGAMLSFDVTVNPT